MKFFYANEPDKPFRFVKTPKSLFEDEKYANVSPYAKFLYSFMLDRVSLSKKDEEWVDRDGRVFIYFRIQEVMSLFQIANEKATKLYKELENAGLIQREKNGYGKPIRIYVCDVLEGIHENRESIITESVTNTHENREYIVTKNRSNTHENRDTSLYETENNDTDLSDTNNLPPNPPTGGTGEAADADSDFDRFWEEYPRKQGKGAALKAYRKARKKITAEEMLSAVRRQKASWDWTKDGGQYVPQPATWLNQERWSDELRYSPPPKDKAKELPSDGFKIVF